jgi:ribonuclease Z
MFELVFLGTSGGRPTATRGLPGLMVLHDEERFLVDCGDGTDRQLIRSGLGHRRLRRILLSHEHLDHLLGVAGVLAAVRESHAVDRVTVHGGAEALRLVKTIADDVVLPETDGGVDIKLEALEPEADIVTDSLTIHPIAVSHRDTGAFAFLFKEADRRHFDPKKVASLGISEETARATLYAGRAAVAPDGAKVSPSDVMGPVQAGTRLLVVGDIALTEPLEAIAEGIDGLVIEATFLDRDRDLARRSGHLTAREAAAFAEQVGVGTLFLTHLSGRYHGNEIAEEARTEFPEAIVANDLGRYQVSR